MAHLLARGHPFDWVDLVGYLPGGFSAREYQSLCNKFVERSVRLHYKFKEYHLFSSSLGLLST